MKAACRVCLRPDHFARKPDGSPVDVANDYVKPFIKRFISEVRAIDPKAILFLEGIPDGRHPQWTASDEPNAGARRALVRRHDAHPQVLPARFQCGQGDVSTRHGRRGRAAAFQQPDLPKRRAHDIPSFLGEFGLPFDLNDKSGYQTGDFTPHTQALSMYYNALDANLLSATIWNYTADNINAHGELWNDEDLSLFSRDQQDKPWTEDIHAGGRAVAGFVRPYAMSIAGEPLRMAYDLTARTFELEFRRDPAVSAPTEIFVPAFVYPQGYQVEAERRELH